MLAYASHPDDDAEVPIERLRQDPHLRGYVEGWGRRGDLGYILEVGSRALGAAWVRLPAAMDRSDPTYVDEDTPWLAIGVVPSARGHGWGTKLLAALLDALRGRVPAVVLTVRRSNRAANLYARFGFQPVGEVTNRVGGQSTKMVLRLDNGGLAPRAARSYPAR